MLDLNDLALFVQIVHAGSFAEAARRLGLRANFASRRIQELEKVLGVRLMQRSTRRLTLTDAGHNLFAQCAEHVQALTQSAQELSEGSEVPLGKVRIAAMAEFLNSFSIDWVSDFLSAHPKVQLEFLLSDERADLLGEGIDIAFRAGKAIEPNLIARIIGWAHMTLVASPAYVEARGMPESPIALSMHDCIISPTGPSGYVTWRLDGPKGDMEVDVRGRFHANSAQAQLGATLAGLGIALLPRPLSAPHLESGRLLKVLPDYELRIGVYIVYLSRRQLPRAVSTFIEFAMSKMLDEGLLEPPSPVKQAGK